MRQLLHKSVSEWSALGIPTRLLGGGDREQETLFFFLIYRYEILYCRHTESMQHTLPIRREIKCNEARVSNGSSAAFVDRAIIDRDRETAVRTAEEDGRTSGDGTVLSAVDSVLLTLCDYHSCRIKAAWRPTPC